MIVALLSSAVSYIIDTRYGLLGVLTTFLVSLFAANIVKGVGTAELLGGAIAAALVYAIVQYLGL